MGSFVSHPVTRSTADTERTQLNWILWFFPALQAAGMYWYDKTLNHHLCISNIKQCLVWHLSVHKVLESQCSSPSHPHLGLCYWSIHAEVSSGRGATPFATPQAQKGVLPLVNHKEVFLSPFLHPGQTEPLFHMVWCGLQSTSLLRVLSEQAGQHCLLRWQQPFVRMDSWGRQLLIPDHQLGSGPAPGS